jgi:GTP-binding protein
MPTTAPDLSANPADLFKNRAAFFKGVPAMRFLPEADRPEVAFAGRSNVGKSSLLNALTGVKGLARTSNTPGRTQEMNFFDLAGVGYIVDLPGYGYAKASKRDIARWNATTNEYLQGRPNLQRVYVLIDCRHGLKDNDRELMKDLDVAAVSYQLILTKADKIKAGALDKVRKAVEAEALTHPASFPRVLTTSAEKPLGPLGGIMDLREAVARVLLGLGDDFGDMFA